jgi:hypothetical protein
MGQANINSPIASFKSAVNKGKKIVGFTGAGISTESGIPDYRSKGGIWDKFQPVYFEEFVSDEKKRLLYWQRKQELWSDLSAASPNTGHMFFKKLHDKGKLSGLITQNIDGLHEKSGLAKELIINRGISDDKIRDLQIRLDEECIDIGPEILSILIGVNDTLNTPPELFEEEYRLLLKQTTDALNSKIILCEPFLLLEDNNAYRNDLNPKIEIVNKLSK